MKIKIWALGLACLIVFTVSAVSAIAQEEPSAPDPRLHQLLHSRLKPPKVFIGDASTAGKTSQQTKSSAATSDATNACTYTFTSGSGATYLQFCVTVNGNIVEFQSPAGIEQIDQGVIGEGYGICDVATGVAYYDYAYEDSSNWKAPTTTHTATMVKIVRTTSDNLWTITQTITSIPGTNPYAKVLMALKNNSSSTKTAYLLRWADAAPGNAAQTDTTFAENLDGTQDSAWGYIPISDDVSYGLMLQNVGNTTPVSVPSAREGFAQSNDIGTPPCDFSTYFASPVINADGSIVYIWAFDLNKGQTVSVASRYLSF